MYTKENAEITIRQLGGVKRLNLFVGAKNFTFDESERSVSFKFKGGKDFNYVKIILMPDDTYTMEFMKLVSYNVKNTKKIEDVYCDQLIPVFEKNTGLYLKF